MKVLITGASGFIAGRLIEHLHKKHTIAGLLMPDEICHTKNGIKIFRADVTNKESLKSIADWPEAVVHCAGLTKARYEQSYYDVNSAGTRNLLESIIENNPYLRQFILLSSIAVGGPLDDLSKPLLEQDIPAPIDTYGKSKLMAEKYLKEYDIPTTALRLASVYGGGSTEYLFYFRMAKKRIRIVTDFDKMPFSLLHVADLCKSIQCIIENDYIEKNATYYLSDDIIYNIENVSKSIISQFANKYMSIKISQRTLQFIGNLVEFYSNAVKKPCFLNKERVSMLSKSYLCSTKKFFSHYHPGAFLSIDDGIKECISWYENAGWL